MHAQPEEQPSDGISAHGLEALEAMFSPAQDFLVSPQEAALCFEYLTDFDATRASLAAGYPGESAHETARRVLQKENVRGYLYYLFYARLSRLESVADRVLATLVERARLDEEAFVSLSELINRAYWVFYEDMEPVDIVRRIMPLIDESGAEEALSH